MVDRSGSVGYHTDLPLLFVGDPTYVRVRLSKSGLGGDKICGVVGEAWRVSPASVAVAGEQTVEIERLSR